MAFSIEKAIQVAIFIECILYAVFRLAIQLFWNVHVHYRIGFLLYIFLICTSIIWARYDKLNTIRGNVRLLSVLVTMLLQQQLWVWSIGYRLSFRHWLSIYVQHLGSSVDKVFEAVLAIAHVVNSTKGLSNLLGAMNTIDDVIGIAIYGFQTPVGDLSWQFFSSVVCKYNFRSYDNRYTECILSRTSTRSSAFRPLWHWWEVLGGLDAFCQFPATKCVECSCRSHRRITPETGTQYCCCARPYISLGDRLPRADTVYRWVFNRYVVGIFP